MYQVVIIPKNTTANCALSFKTQQAAEKIYKRVFDYLGKIPQEGEEGPPFEDDYGYKLTIRPDDICYCLFVDVFESQMVQFDKNMVMDKASQTIDKKLRDLGFKPQPPSNQSRIIQ